jgi:putative iron-dependent peroxidase
MMAKQFSQPGILDSTSVCGRSLVFRIAPEVDPRPALTRFRDGFNPDWGVVGLGEPLILALGCEVPGLRTFPALSGPSCAIPSTQQTLWIFLRGQGPTELFDRFERIKSLTDAAFILDDAMETFTYAGGRDLTGYVDGTANPSPEESPAVAFVESGEGLTGSSFVAVQRWEHDLARFRSHSQTERDDMIGRSIETNEELDDAPEFAHVRRTAQEEFEPEAFMVRRSMPWATEKAQGLEFIAYGSSLDPFEQVLRHMAGLDDGITDALFTFSRPVTGGNYWCPPVKSGRIDLSFIGV